MRIGIHFIEDPIIRGPQKVVKNLLMGLAEVGISPLINIKGDFNICLQSFPGIMNFDSKKTLIRPNISTIPPSDSAVCGLLEKYANFLVPCDWVKKSLLTFPEFSTKKVHVWPVGIDTDTFNIQKWYEWDCFIYHKNRSKADLDIVKSFLNDRNYHSGLLSYGCYSEESLKDICKKSNFCIILDNTESQGIAIMEILSMNTPCYVIDHTICDYNGWGKYKYSASSAPYFSDECGMIGNLNFKDFDKFISYLKKYRPREYILREHTLQASARKLLEIINSI